MYRRASSLVLLAGLAQARFGREQIPVPAVQAVTSYVLPLYKKEDIAEC